MTVNIYLVDDNLTFLNAVTGFLAQVPDVTVVGQSTLGHDALMQIAHAKPDLVLLDVGLSDVNGMELAREMGAWKQPPHIIFLSTYEGKPYLAMAEEVGALGFIDKADFVVELPVFLATLGTLSPRGARP